MKLILEMQPVPTIHTDEASKWPSALPDC